MSATTEPTTVGTNARDRELLLGNAGPLVVAVMGKGGDGKTTTTASLGCTLARMVGWDVTLVDLDAQGSLTRWLLGPLEEGRTTVDDVLTRDAALADVLADVPYPGALKGRLRLAPVANGLAVVEGTLDPDDLGTEVVAASDSQVLVLDTPATRPLGPSAVILRAALDVADVVVLPFQPTSMSFNAMEEALEQVEAYEEEHDRKVPTLLLPTMVNGSMNLELVTRALRLGGLRVLPEVRASRWAKRAVDAGQLLSWMPAGGGVTTDYDSAGLALAAALVSVAEVGN